MVVKLGMKIYYLKLKSWLLATVMGAFGLTSCHCHKQLAEPEPAPEPKVQDRGEIRLMYGVPTMNYMIRGQVQDPKGKPVRDIRVNMLERNMELAADGMPDGDSAAVNNWLEGTEVRTDHEGRFSINTKGLPQEQVRILVRDVDGKDNGNYGNQVLEIPVKQDDLDRTDANGWNRGTFSKELKIKLKRK